MFKSGKRISHDGLQFIVKQNKLDTPRLGLAISKKQIPHAVDRNKIKRLCRESFRLHDELGNVDVVIMAKRGIESLSKAAIREKLEGLWLRVTC